VSFQHANRIFASTLSTIFLPQPLVLSDRQTFETPTRYYGNGFHAGSLPDRQNLEDEPKKELYGKFARATKKTQKGEYSESNNAKIKHASKLLALVNPAMVAARCPRFATFTNWLSQQIEKA
jgi:hypothetical protein